MELSTLKKVITDQVVAAGYLLYDIEYVKERKSHILRVLIDKIEGIDIDDCITVSDLINPTLDELDPFTEDYALEVSSPGAERKLRNAAEITRAVGKFVHVETAEQKIEGELVAYQNQQLTVKVRTKIIEIAESDCTLIRMAIKM
jgi:ribosome maturation factor RimP